jgi:hypothetical protein
MIKRTGNAFADLMMFIGVFITGGVFALLGYRKVSILRLSIELLIIAAIGSALYYFGQPWLLPSGVSSLNIHDPLHRSLLFVAGAIVLAYAGGVVVSRAWNWKGDPRIAMLFLAIGMTLIGLRLTSVAFAVGEIRIASTRVDAGEAGLTAIKSAIAVLREHNVDPKPLAGVILRFQKDVYGSSVIEGFYASIGKPLVKIDDADLKASPDTKEADTAGHAVATEAQSAVAPEARVPAEQSAHPTPAQ